eukprot:scaffold3392_cov278-Prasinococcus_capsulatus_cf.AAC.1
MSPACAWARARTRAVAPLLGLLLALSAAVGREHERERERLIGWQGEVQRGQHQHVDDGEASTRALACQEHPNTELWGDVVVWGDGHVVPSAEACCDACKRSHAEHQRRRGGGGKVRAALTRRGRAPRGALTPRRAAQGCNTWVWCAAAEGCGRRAHGECWLKHNKRPQAVYAPRARRRWAADSATLR